MNKITEIISQHFKEFILGNYIFYYALNIGKTKPDKFPRFYNLQLVFHYFKRLKSIEERISYIDLLINNFSKIKTFSTDVELKIFIKKYKLDRYVRPYNSDLNTKCLKIHNELKFVSKKYGGFQQGILREISFLSLIRKIYVDLNKALNSDFKLVFEKEDFKYIYDSFNKDDERLEWVVKLTDYLNDIGFLPDDSAQSIIFNKYELRNKFQTDRKTIKGFVMHFNIFHTQFESFRFYLKNDFIPFIDEYAKDIIMNKNIADSLSKYPDRYENDEEKFPHFGFEYEKIMKYCDGVFEKTHEKIQYLSYVVNSFNLWKEARFSDKKSKHSVSLLELKLAHLKNVFELEIKTNPVVLPDVKLDTSDIVTEIKDIISSQGKSNNLTPINKVIPKSKQYDFLVKHYLLIAKTAEDVPKLKQLETKEHSVPFWSKQFKDLVFLYELLKEIKSKIESDKINKSTRELLIQLKGDIDSKITKALKSENSKTGSKHITQKSVDDRFKDDESFDASDYYDKSDDD